MNHLSIIGGRKEKGIIKPSPPPIDSGKRRGYETVPSCHQTIECQGGNSIIIKKEKKRKKKKTSNHNLIYFEPGLSKTSVYIVPYVPLTILRTSGKGKKKKNPVSRRVLAESGGHRAYWTRENLPWPDAHGVKGGRGGKKGTTLSSCWLEGGPNYFHGIGLEIPPEGRVRGPFLLLSARRQERAVGLNYCSPPTTSRKERKRGGGPLSFSFPLFALGDRKGEA